MIVDSCVAVPAASSMWTVQRRRSCEDRSGLCVSLERQGRHAQLNAGTDGWGSRRPVNTVERVRRQVVKTVEHQHAQFKFHTLSDGQPMQNVAYCGGDAVIVRSLSHARGFPGSLSLMLCHVVFYVIITYDCGK